MKLEDVGYSRKSNSHFINSERDQFAPLKSFPMQALMLYMTGYQINIFSIGFLLMTCLNLVKGLASSFSAANFFSHSPLVLAIAYKLYWMDLLPKVEQEQIYETVFSLVNRG